jgi:hypothetical protein
VREGVVVACVEGVDIRFDPVEEFGVRDRRGLDDFRESRRSGRVCNAPISAITACG